MVVEMVTFFTESAGIYKFLWNLIAMTAMQSSILLPQIPMKIYFTWLVTSNGIYFITQLGTPELRNVIYIIYTVR